MNKISTFRFIDCWIGIPICFILTPLHYLQRFWLSLFIRPNSEPKRILIIKLAELGAIVYAYPLFKKINKEYPNAKIYIITFQKNREILELFDGFIKIEQLITIREDNILLLFKDLCEAIFSFVWLKFEVSIDLEFFSRISAILTFFSGAFKTIGFYPYGLEGLYRGDFLTHKVLYNPLRHVTVNYLALLQALHQSRKDSPEIENEINNPYAFPAYSSNKEIRQQLSRFELPDNKRIFLVNPGEGAIPIREWPLENFKHVIQAILEDEGNIILLVGAASANLKADQLMIEINNERMINLCGLTSLKELMEILLMSHLLITNDGGLAHFAILTPLKTIVFFGPETPVVFGPLGPNIHVYYSHWPCSPCLSAYNHRASGCHNNQCLKSIRPEEVIKFIKLIV